MSDRQAQQPEQPEQLQPCCSISSSMSDNELDPDTAVYERQAINFNQDYTSLSVVCPGGYRLFCVSGVECVEEIFGSKPEDVKIAERLFSSSLVAIVPTADNTKLKVCHFRKGTEICNYNYPSEILAVRLNRSRMIISLASAIYMHNIRDMKMLHSIQHKTPNTTGLCALSLNSHLAYPVGSAGSVVGELQIFDCANLRAQMRIKAHESPLAALCFSANGVLVATASEKGTVIRVFCVHNGHRVHEFRRGVKRYVRIASLNFSSCASFLSVSSNTETVHVFRIDQQAVDAAERKVAAEFGLLPEKAEASATNGDGDATAAAATAPTAAAAGSAASAAGDSSSMWSMGYLTKAVSAYFPTQVSDVLTQDRAFATVQLPQAGLRYECVITKLEKELRLLVACEDGFMYIYALDEQRGGECKKLRVHDLRASMCGMIEIPKLKTTPNGSVIQQLEAELSESPTAVLLGSDSYARALRGGADPDPMSAESVRLFNLHEAIDPPPNIFEGVAFPPVGNAVAATGSSGSRCD